MITYCQDVIVSRESSQRFFLGLGWQRGRVRLHEKGGKRHEVPANHNLAEYLEACIKGADVEVDPPMARRFLGLSGHQENLPAIRAAGLGAGRKAANVDDSTGKGA